MEDVPNFLTENNGAVNGRDLKGRFSKGNPGRPLGATRNRMREQIKTFLSDKWLEFPQWFDSLKPNEKIKAYQELLPYGVSKLQTVAIEEDREIKDAQDFDMDKLSDDDLRDLQRIQEKARI